MSRKGGEEGRGGEGDGLGGCSIIDFVVMGERVWVQLRGWVKREI